MSACVCARPQPAAQQLRRIPFAALDRAQERHLGRGYFGTVSRMLWNDVLVAVKAARVEHGASLAKEVHSLGWVRPAPNVLPVLGVCEDAADGAVRIISEYCPGGNLTKFLARATEVRSVA